MSVHPTALVDREARVDSGVEIGPFVVVEADVEIGAGTRVAANAVLKSGLRVGCRVKIHEGAVLGGPPQDLKFDGGPSYARVGDDCVIREFSTIHRSAHENGITHVGARCFLMGYGHIAHDCRIADDVIIASYVALAGHIEVGEGAFISGGAAIHQFSRIGSLAMIGGGSKVNLDVPPFVTADGVPARAVGLNTVGLRRKGIPAEEMRALKRAYRTLYREKRPLAEALDQVDAMTSEYAREFSAFIRASERGVCRTRTG